MMSDRVFRQLQEKFQLERQQIMFTFSHNHCGPRLGDDLVDYYPVEAEQVATGRRVHGPDGGTNRRAGRRGTYRRLAPASLQTGDGTRRSPSIAATTAKPTFLS